MAPVAHDEMSGVPHWQNYVVTQLTQAALGLVPLKEVLALGAEILESSVVIHCVVEPSSPGEPTHWLREVIQELSVLLGEEIRISLADVRRTSEFRLSQADDSVLWFLLAPPQSELDL